MSPGSREQDRKGHTAAGTELGTTETRHTGGGPCLKELRLRKKEASGSAPDRCAGPGVCGDPHAAPGPAPSKTGSTGCPQCPQHWVSKEERDF